MADTPSCASNECTNSGKFGCGACQTVNYCSKDCQKFHWKQHKAICKKMVAKPSSSSSSSSSSRTTSTFFPKAVSLESNMNVPCYTQAEFAKMMGPPAIFPPCIICGKPDSTLWCPKCVQWELPLECYCSRPCFEVDFPNHVKRLHEPLGMWVAAKERILSSHTLNVDAGSERDKEGVSMRGRIMTMIEATKPHPRDRISEMQKVGRMGQSFASETF
jgi:hypothetical protein